jgi:hypothetical protein
MSPSTFVRELSHWHNQVLVGPPVEQIFAQMQTDEVTEQAMLLPEKNTMRLDNTRVEAVLLNR